MGLVSQRSRNHEEPILREGKGHSSSSSIFRVALVPSAGMVSVKVSSSFYFSTMILAAFLLLSNFVFDCFPSFILQPLQ